MNQNIKNIQRSLREWKLDAFLVSVEINRQYLSGFTGTRGYLLISSNDAWLFVDGRYTLRAKKESDLKILDDSKLSVYLQRIKKVAVEDKISLNEYEHLNKKAAKELFVLSNVVETLRAIKTRQELEAIEKGSKITDLVFVHIVKFVRKNFGKITEERLVNEIKNFGKIKGAQAPFFDPIVAFGANSAIPHHLSSHKIIGKNNFLLFDISFLINGYHSDFSRTIFIGKPNKYQERVYNLVLSAQVKALNAISVGKKAADVHATVVREFKKNKMEKYFTHNTGHGLGLEIHELPNFSPGSNDTLEKNMVVTVEPGLYLPHKFGVRIEDMVIVGQKPRILSKIPKDLRAMIV